MDMFDIGFAKRIVLQIKEAFASTRKVSIIWHGGEPLLWGKENYREILSFMQQELEGYYVHQSIQTNLSLVDEEYLDILSQYNVKLGFSLDGTREIHDSQRVGIGGQPTFDTIMKKLALCRERDLKIGCIVVGSRKHIGHIPELYQFMKEQELNFKFNPLFISGEAEHNRDEYGITAHEYAEMCIELFDLWFDDREGKVTESNFVEIASNIATGKATGCMFSHNCQDNFLAIAPHGDVMPCGRFCDDDMRQFAYGNLRNETLSEILSRIKQNEIYKRAEYVAQSDCAKCKWYNICHGGCMHDGFLRNGDFKSKTLLCPAYKQIFAHIEQQMQEVGILEQSNHCTTKKKRIKMKKVFLLSMMCLIALAMQAQSTANDGYVDLGLPSGTLWKSKNEKGVFKTYDEAMEQFKGKLPTQEHWEELKGMCDWEWENKGYKVTGPNGNSIFLPAAGFRYCGGSVGRVGSFGYYWSSTSNGSELAWELYFSSSSVNMYETDRCYGQSVRLVQD